MIMENAFADRKEAILNALIDRKGIQYLTDVAAEMLLLLKEKKQY